MDFCYGSFVSATSPLVSSLAAKYETQREEPLGVVTVDTALVFFACESCYFENSYVDVKKRCTLEEKMIINSFLGSLCSLRCQTTIAIT